MKSCTSLQSKQEAMIMKMYENLTVTVQYMYHFKVAG